MKKKKITFKVAIVVKNAKGYCMITTKEDGPIVLQEGETFIIGRVSK